MSSVISCEIKACALSDRSAVILKTERECVYWHCNNSMLEDETCKDTQLYITFTESSQERADSCITTLEKCIQEIRSWMRQNFLKLNDEKHSFFYLDHVSNYQNFVFHLLQLVTRR